MKATEKRVFNLWCFEGDSRVDSFRVREITLRNSIDFPRIENGKFEKKLFGMDGENRKPLIKSDYILQESVTRNRR